jgi:hypothetical protein
MHRAGKVHPLLTRHGYAGVGVDCVRDQCPPRALCGSIDKRAVSRRGMACDSGTSGGNRNSAAPEMGAEARDLMQFTAMCQEVHA